MGGERLFGKVNYNNAPVVAPGTGGIDGSGNVRIPSPAVMPDFFNKLTWRNRVLEKAIYIANDDNWTKRSFLRNTVPTNRTGVSSLALGPAKGSVFIDISGNTNFGNIPVVKYSENFGSADF